MWSWRSIFFSGCLNILYIICYSSILFMYPDIIFSTWLIISPVSWLNDPNRYRLKSVAFSFQIGIVLICVRNILLVRPYYRRRLAVRMFVSARPLLLQYRMCFRCFPLCLFFHFVPFYKRVPPRMTRGAILIFL